MPNWLDAGARRLRKEDGLGLVEILVSQTISGVVLAAAVMGVLVGLRIMGSTADRINSTQSGRIAMDQIAQRMRSQTCLFPGEYNLNGGTAGTIRAPNILHANPNKIMMLTDVGAAAGATGATGAVSFVPELRTIEVSGPVGPTGSGVLIDSWRSSLTTVRPFRFQVASAITGFDVLASATGAVGATPSISRAMVDKIQYANGFSRHFTYYNDAGTQVAEVNGVVPSASLESITRIQLAYKVGSASGSSTNNGKSTQFVNNFYVRAITDRCEGG